MLVFDSQTMCGISTKTGKDGSVKQGVGEWTLYARMAKKGPPAWQVSVPVRPRAMLLAGKVLFLAGTPDVEDPKDPWAAIDGKKGALLWAVSMIDGKRLNEIKLAVAPVWDALAAANGRLYVSMKDGTLACFGKPAEK